jgi:hypothetical protein
MEQKKIVREIFIGLFMMILSLLTLIVFIPQQVQLSTTFGQEIGFSSRSFPYITTGLIGVAAMIQVIVSIISYLKIRKKHMETKEKQPNKNMYGEVLSIVIFMLFVAYAFIFSKFGFIIASVIIPPIILFVLKSEKKVYYVSVYGFIALVFVVFQYLLKIQLISL